jgi:hypothetical protein
MRVPIASGRILAGTVGRDGGVPAADRFHPGMKPPTTWVCQLR